ncbi:MAG: 50S ribosomal protein L18e [Candidatus Hydrothermarchaeaceae archaeon]
MKKSKSSNPVLIGLIREMNKKAYEEKTAAWRDLAGRLSKPSSRRAAVNIARIARHTEKKDVVAVPGKVLGSGTLDHPVTVAAFEFSTQARKKILSAGGKCISLGELMDKKPRGTSVRIME